MHCAGMTCYFQRTCNSGQIKGKFHKNTQRHFLSLRATSLPCVSFLPSAFWVGELFKRVSFLIIIYIIVFYYNKVSVFFSVLCLKMAESLFSRLQKIILITGLRPSLESCSPETAKLTVTSN